MNRIVTNNLADGTERLIATAEMLAEAQGVINTFPIEDVITCPSDLDGSALHEVWARIGDKLDVTVRIDLGAAQVHLAGAVLTSAPVAIEIPMADAPLEDRWIVRAAGFGPTNWDAVHGGAPLDRNGKIVR